MVILAVFIGILESLNVAIMYPILSYGLGTQTTSNQFLSFISMFEKLIPINDSLVRFCILFAILAFLVFIGKLFFAREDRDFYNIHDNKAEKHDCHCPYFFQDRLILKKQFPQKRNACAQKHENN